MSGCVRRTPLQCERLNNRSEGGGKADVFLKLQMIKVPDLAEWSYRTKDDCRKQCLENCSCVAYAYDTGIGCMSWSGNLIDLQKFSTGGIELQKSSTAGLDIYIFVCLIWNLVRFFFFFNSLPVLHTLMLMIIHQTREKL